MRNIRCQKVSPIIAEVQERASLHRQEGEHNVSIAEVATSDFEPYRLSIQLLKDCIDMNGVLHPGIETLFFPMEEMGNKFSIDFWSIQRS